MKYIFIVALFAALTLPQAFLFPASVSACSCIAGDTATYFQNSENVILGTVTALDGVPESGTGSGTVTATIKIDNTFRGGLTGSVDIETPDASAACGYNFQLGQQELFYFSEIDGVYSTNLCAGNGIATEEVLAELELLALTVTDDVVVPTEEVPPLDTSDPTPTEPSNLDSDQLTKLENDQSDLSEKVDLLTILVLANSAISLVVLILLIIGQFKGANKE